MIEPSKRNRNPNKSARPCECRPVCKNRRRKWKGEVQKTSAELLLERQPQKECLKKYPNRTHPNGACPLSTKPRSSSSSQPNRRSNIVTICETPIADNVPTPYLKFVEMAKRLGAWGSVKEKCAFCSCSGCCLCSASDYALREEESVTRRCNMRQFDERVKTDAKTMRIMYNKL